MKAQKVKGNCCSTCTETHEKCGDKKTCTKWRVSYEVCVVFGTRPSKPGFMGARTSA